MTRRRDPRRLARRRLTATAIAAALLAAITYYAFARPDPFGDAYSISADFSSAAALRPGNPVRLAGVDIGTVAGVSAGPGGSARVRLRITDTAQVLHRDLRLQIRERLFLEGNAYVAVEPGSPSARRLPRGAVVGRAHTSSPVQIDEVLSTLTTPTRTALRDTIGQVASGLGGAGADGLREGIDQLDGALAGYTRVARAVQGTRRGELRATIRSTAGVSEQLAADPGTLRRLVVSADRVLQTLAARRNAVGQTVDELARLGASAPADLATIDRTLPMLTRTARRLRPTLRAAPAVLRQATAAVAQLGALSRRSELPALLDGADPLLGHLPTLLRRLQITLKRSTPVTDCVASKVVPTLQMTVPDGANSTGRPVWQDVLHATAALAAASPNFDGNGTTIRLGVSGGEQAISGALPGFGQISGTAAGAAAGVAPVSLGPNVLPPSHPEAPCAEQGLPDLSKRRGGAPAALADLRSSSSGPTASQLTRLLQRLARRPAPTKQHPPAGHAPSLPRPLSSTPVPTPRHPPAATTPTALAPTIEKTVKTVGGILDHLLGRRP